MRNYCGLVWDKNWELSIIQSSEKKKHCPGKLVDFKKLKHFICAVDQKY